MAGEIHFFILTGILVLQYGALQSWKGQDRPFWLYDDAFRGSWRIIFKTGFPSYSVMPVDQYEERGQE
jgi:hypothetical protein